MKKVIVAMAVVAIMAGSSLGLAEPARWFLGPDGKPKGCLCEIKGCVLMAQNEADCTKAGGKVVKPAKDAGSKAK